MRSLAIARWCCIAPAQMRPVPLMQRYFCTDAESRASVPCWAGLMHGGSAIIPCRVCRMPGCRWKPNSKHEDNRQMSKSPTATLTLPVGKRDHIQGSSAAVVTLVEYGDCQCPFCGDAYP